MQHKLFTFKATSDRRGNKAKTLTVYKEGLFILLILYLIVLLLIAPENFALDLGLVLAQLAICAYRSK